MVDPVFLIAAPIGIAFLLPLFDKLGRSVTLIVQGLTLLGLIGLTGWWTSQLLGGAEPMLVTTGGWPPPLGISLRLGLPEASLVLIGQLTAFGALLYQYSRKADEDVRGLLLQLVILAGATGLILTRDMFNVFVFMEITSIATYALAAMGREDDALEAGFKYMVLGGMASTFVLAGIALLYKHTGTLNIDRMVELLPTITLGPGIATAVAVVFLVLLVGFAAELKLIPLNGPGVDLYDGVEPGVTALYVGTAVNGLAFAFYKIYAVFPESWDAVVVGLGAATFVGANLSALRQLRVRRMLGWSSSSQIGLIVALIPFVRGGQVPLAAMMLLLVNHSLAKSALLGLSGLHGSPLIEKWRGVFASSPLRRLSLFGALIALLGLPPFPGFFGKWDALVGLAQHGQLALIGVLLVGSLAELAWGFRFARQLLEDAEPEAEQDASLASMFSPAVLTAVLLAAASWQMLSAFPMPSPAVLLLLGVGLLLLILKDLPGQALALVSLAALLGALGLGIWQGQLELSTLSGFFTTLTLGAGVLVALATSGSPGRRGSLHGLFVLLVGSILLILEADQLLTFFVGWEIMTWTSALAIGQGDRGAKPSWVYLVFAGAGGFLVLGGLMVALAANVSSFSGLAGLSFYNASLFWGLMVSGILVKLGVFGAHIWAPDAYAEAPDTYSAFLSGVVSKAPIFALALVLSKVAAPAVPLLTSLQVEWTQPVAWLGLLTAFGMTMLALFQEDAKRLLAYSSLGQLGYVVMALAVMSPLSWEAGLYHALHHTLFKALLFLAVAGVIHRTGTRKMYQMGGLIHRMPLSYISVMVGIIALSGVPPLGGFLGKWMLYESIIERGWLLLAALAMFSSLLAFLYLFRLIHSIFLGQLKPEHRELREAPWPILVSQVVLMIALVGLGAWPQVVLRPLDSLVTSLFGESGVQFTQYGLTTPVGHFEPLWMMTLVGIVFVVVLVLQLVVVPKAPRVGTLDIGFAGEVPPPADEIHYAWDFFRPVYRAYRPILSDRILRFWKGVVDAVEALTDSGRALWTGHAQTYVLYMVALAVGLAVFGLVP